MVSVQQSQMSLRQRGLPVGGQRALRSVTPTQQVKRRRADREYKQEKAEYDRQVAEYEKEKAKFEREQRIQSKAINIARRIASGKRIGDEYTSEGREARGRAYKLLEDSGFWKAGAKQVAQFKDQFPDAKVFATATGFRTEGAKIDVPEGYRFLGGKDGQLIVESPEWGKRSLYEHQKLSKAYADLSVSNFEGQLASQNLRPVRDLDKTVVGYATPSGNIVSFAQIEMAKARGKPLTEEVKTTIPERAKAFLGELRKPSGLRFKTRDIETPTAVGAIALGKKVVEKAPIYYSQAKSFVKEEYPGFYSFVKKQYETPLSLTSLEKKDGRYTMIDVLAKDIKKPKSEFLWKFSEKFRKPTPESDREIEKQFIKRYGYDIMAENLTQEEADKRMRKDRVFKDLYALKERTAFGVDEQPIVGRFRMYQAGGIRTTARVYDFLYPEKRGDYLKPIAVGAGVAATVKTFGAVGAASKVVIGKTATSTIGYGISGAIVASGAYRVYKADSAEGVFLGGTSAALVGASLGVKGFKFLAQKQITKQTLLPASKKELLRWKKSPYTVSPGYRYKIQSRIGKLTGSKPFYSDQFLKVAPKKLAKLEKTISKQYGITTKRASRFTRRFAKPFEVRFTKFGARGDVKKTLAGDRVTGQTMGIAGTETTYKISQPNIIGYKGYKVYERVPRGLGSIKPISRKILKKPIIATERIAQTKPQLMLEGEKVRALGEGKVVIGKKKIYDYSTVVDKEGTKRFLVPMQSPKYLKFKMVTAKSKVETFKKGWVKKPSGKIEYRTDRGLVTDYKETKPFKLEKDDFIGRREILVKGKLTTTDLTKMGSFERVSLKVGKVDADKLIAGTRGVQKSKGYYLGSRKLINEFDIKSRVIKKFGIEKVVEVPKIKPIGDFKIVKKTAEVKTMPSRTTFPEQIVKDAKIPTPTTGGKFDLSLDKSITRQFKTGTSDELIAPPIFLPRTGVLSKPAIITKSIDVTGQAGIIGQLDFTRMQTQQIPLVAQPQKIQQMPDIVSLQQPQTQIKQTQVQTVTPLVLTPPTPPTTTVTPTTPKIIVPILPTLKKRATVSGRVLTEPGEAGYRVLVRRRGEFKPLPGIFAKGEAIQKGKKVVDTTLAATFRLERTKRSVRPSRVSIYTPRSKQFRDYKIVKGKKVPLVNEWIERKTKRLTRTGETREIQMFRKQKGGRKRII